MRQAIKKQALRLLPRVPAWGGGPDRVPGQGRSRYPGEKIGYFLAAFFLVAFFAFAFFAFFAFLAIVSSQGFMD